MELNAEQRFGPYQLIRPLGRSAGSQTWVAQAPNGSLVSLKFVQVVDDFVLDPKVATWLRLEAESNPNLAALVRIGRHEDHAWLASEYVEGATWTEVLDLCRVSGARLPVDAVVDLVAPIAAALESAHSLRVRHKNLLHRAIEPGKLLLDRDGAPRLIEFDVAYLERVPDTDEEQRLVSYSAPEQVSGHQSPALDVFALGAVLYELVVGEVLYPPTSRGGAADLLANKQDLTYLVSRLDENEQEVGPFRDVLAGMLHPDPERRWNAGDAERGLLAVRPPRQEGLDTGELYKLLFGDPTFPLDGEPDPAWVTLHRVLAAHRGLVTARTQREIATFGEQDHSEYDEAPTEVFVRPAGLDDASSLRQAFEQMQARSRAPAPKPAAEPPPQVKVETARPKRPSRPQRAHGTVPFDEEMSLNGNEELPPIPTSRRQSDEAVTELVSRETLAAILPPKPGTGVTPAKAPPPPPPAPPKLAPPPPPPVQAAVVSQAPPPAMQVPPAQPPTQDPLRAQVAAPPPPSSGGSSLLQVVGVGVVMFVAGVGGAAYFLSPSSPTPAPVAPSQPVAAASVAGGGGGGAATAAAVPAATPEATDAEAAEEAAPATPEPATPTPEATDAEEAPAPTPEPEATEDDAVVEADIETPPDPDAPLACFADADGDGVGSDTPAACGKGAASTSGDCDDNDPSRAPGAQEKACSGLDEDCDGEDGCHLDGDGDGFAGKTIAAGPPNCSTAGFSCEATDCDDTRRDRSPAASEACNGYDDDCDGETDEGCEVSRQVKLMHVPPTASLRDAYDSAELVFDLRPKTFGCTITKVKGARGDRTVSASGSQWKIPVKDVAQSRKAYERGGLASYTVTWCCGDGDCASESRSATWE